MVRITQKYLDNRVDYLAKMFKIRAGCPDRTKNGAKYPYRDSCMYISGANGRHSLEIHNRKGHLWGSPWLTKSEMDLYLTGMMDMARVQELKKDKKF